MGGGGEAGPVDDRRHRLAQDGNVGSRRLVHGRRVEAKETAFAGEGPVGVVALHADVVEGRRTVDGGPGGGLGQDERDGVRRLPAQLGGDAGEAAGRGGRVGGGVVAQDPEARSGDGSEDVVAFLGADEVVLPEAQEHEVVVGHEAEEVAGLGDLPGVARRRPLLELGRQHLRLGLHGRPVLHRRPHVVEDGEEPVPQRLEPLPGRLAVDLDVEEGLGGAGADGGEVPVVVAADGDDGVDDEVQPAALPDQLHRHGVEQERHVVDDDLDDRVGRRPAVVVEGRRVDPGLGRAGRPALGQVEVGQGGAGQVDRVAPDEVLGRDPLPVGRDQVLGRVGRRAVEAGPHVGRRPVQQAVPGFLKRHRHAGPR